MTLTMRLKGFIKATNGVFNSNDQDFLDCNTGITFSLKEVKYKTPADGRNALKKDWEHFSRDFRGATKEAKRKIENGEAISAK